MSREKKLPPELTAFEAELASLRPQAGNLDMGRLMFLAGRESALENSRRWTWWAWPAAFTAMTATAAVLLVMLVNRPGPQIVERIVRVQVPQPMEDLAHAASDKPATETVVTTAAPNKREKSTFPNSDSALAVFSGALSFKNRAISNPAINGNKIEYRALCNRILVHGIDDWPDCKSSSVRSKSNKPITRLDWTKALFADEG